LFAGKKTQICALFYLYKDKDNKINNATIKYKIMQTKEESNTGFSPELQNALKIYFSKGQKENSLIEWDIEFLRETQSHIISEWYFANNDDNEANVKAKNLLGHLQIVIDNLSEIIEKLNEPL
jgi:hypothetical protein